MKTEADRMSKEMLEKGQKNDWQGCRDDGDKVFWAIFWTGYFIAVVVVAVMTVKVFMAVMETFFGW